MSATEKIMAEINRLLGPYTDWPMAEYDGAIRALTTEVTAILDAEEQRIRDEVEDEVGPGARP